MEYAFTYSGNLHKVKIESIGDSKIASVDGKKEVKVEVLSTTRAASLGVNILSLAINGKVCTAYIAQDREKYYVNVGGVAFTFDKLSEPGVSRVVSTKAVGDTVVSSMPGSLVKLFVTEGEEVSAGKTVAIVEAMKMENELKSPIDGVVKKINFNEGAQVDAFTPIVELTPKHTNENRK